MTREAPILTIGVAHYTGDDLINNNIFLMQITRQSRSIINNNINDNDYLQ